MMRIKLVGKNLDDIKPLLPGYGLEVVENDFELVICHGGDGAMLGAEREYPGVPKLPIRDSRTAPLCPQHGYEAQLTDFVEHRRLFRLPKIVGRCGDQVIYGVNDCFLHNSERSSALRYRVYIDDKLYANSVVGDGVGLASVHGSTAYYRSITHSLFRVGVGLAFSNSTEEINHLVLSEKSLVRIEIFRGPGVLVADNDPKQIFVGEGDVVELRQSDQVAQIYNLDNFMCDLCRMLRHTDRLNYCMALK